MCVCVGGGISHSPKCGVWESLNISRSIWIFYVFSCKFFFQYNYIIGNVHAPKVVISLRSSVFFWPRSLPSTSSKPLRWASFERKLFALCIEKSTAKV